MEEPHWLNDDAVLRIHEFQLAEHGGISGLRDAGLLSSALHRPRNVFAYVPGADIATLAASYAAGIACNHPFLDGNKRTAAVAAETFIRRNGWLLSMSDEDWYITMLSLAAGDLTEEQLATWLRGRLRST